VETHSAYKIIDKKKLGLELSGQEIDWFVQGVTNEDIPRYQLAAFLMAIYCKGMTDLETAALTKSMLNSGKVLKFKGKQYVDKHSTGGVGDKATFILAPIAAACGVKIPMIAGRGLGHTGGTIDKIESLKGMKTNLSEEKFLEYLAKIGMVLIGQTKEIAPADGIFYATRDVTATVESIPLITASIMSKKLAEGANGIVMDIKTGSGSFMVTKKRALELGKSIYKTAKNFNKNVAIILSDMSQPLGQCVGNSLEVNESFETLNNRGPKDLTLLSLELAAHMVLLAGKAKTIIEAKKLCKNALESGAALEKYKEFLKLQGAKTFEAPLANKITIVTAPQNGYVEKFETKEIGMRLVELGGGRKKANEKIDHTVGFKFLKKIGDQVSISGPLLEIYHHESQHDLVKKLTKEFRSSLISFNENKVRKPTLIQKVIV
jgi:pyrimidine-nucleoside phosphorylase